jgi:gluconate 2-dehydrogenase gamma chain
MRRRDFLSLSASSIGGLLVYSADQKSFTAVAQQKTQPSAFRFFTESEARIVVAATSRIFPSDESGPGAKEADVVTYIDRQLAGPYGRDCHRYTEPPFEDGPPEFGYQGKASPREIYREGLKQLSGFDRLSEAEQDAALKQIEDSLFFTLLRKHTIEGMFCDPMHGGNRNMVGWELIGFPGPQMSYYADIDKHYGEAYRPKPMSLRQVTGKQPPLLEDEKCDKAHPGEGSE